MASGRTIGASHLTYLDEQVLALCKKLADFMLTTIQDEEQSTSFLKTYAKLSKARDAGVGLGGGKLQRDALCTRGRTGKAPFSNRNFRWHPLIVAEHCPNFAQEICRIDIDRTNSYLTFVIEENTTSYPSDKVHEMSKRFAVLPQHWFPHIDALRFWGDTEWTQNSCVISAMEAANWWDAVESYAVLGMSVLINEYAGNFNFLHNGIREILNNSNINGVVLPSDNFPSGNDYENIVGCPVCKKPFSSSLEEFRQERRPDTWQPAWGRQKKDEGDDSSVQIMHVNPLIELEMRHNAKNVRYGHRWCNVAMTDHSLDETLSFMEYILNAHNRRGNSGRT